MSRRFDFRRPSRRSRLLLPSSALLLCLGGLGAFSPTSASAASGNSFAFSGALTGTLKLVPADDCDGNAGGMTTLGDIVGKLKGSKSGKWTLIVITPKNGTFKIKPVTTDLAGSTVTLETPGKTVALAWDATKGSITVKGSSGSINVTLKGSPESGASGTVKIKGSWACPST